MKPILEVKNISKKYRINKDKSAGYVSLRDSITNIFNKRKTDSQEDYWALKDVSFDIYPGESVGVIGRNGAGKSTLLKILSKITPPTNGRIVSRGRVASLLEVGTGFHPELTGRENVFLNGSILGLKKFEILKQFDSIVDFSGVEKFLDTQLKHYSSGMQLRLAFAVAAHLEPEILIIDEVLAVGDAEFQKKSIGKMNEVSKSGRTILFVSHNLGLVSQLCNKCFLLNKGQVVKSGDPQSVISHYSSNFESNNKYILNRGDIIKPVFFKEIYTVDEADNPTNVFAHSKSINVVLKIEMIKYLDYCNIGMVLLDKYKKRIFTVNKPLSDFISEKKNEITIKFSIPENLIAPSTYSFLVALNTKTGTETYDWVDDVCSFTVIDDGTDLAFAEGVDYGCIIINGNWKLSSYK